MSQNIATLNLTETQLQAVDAALTELESQLTGLIGLTAVQKRTMPKMGEKSEAFCRQTLNVLSQNPQIVPPNLGLTDAVADLAALDALRPRLVRLSRLSHKATDTEAGLGSDVMAASLRGYNLLKLAGRAEGLETLRKELGSRFIKAPRHGEAKAA